MHGFYGEPEKKTVSFDLVVDFSADADAVKRELQEMLTERYPDYTFIILLDTDYSD